MAAKPVHSPQLTAAIRKMRVADARLLQDDKILPHLEELIGEIKAGTHSGHYPAMLDSRFRFFSGHSLAAARLLAFELWNLQELQEREDVLRHGTNDIETAEMRVIFEISTMAREAIEREYKSVLAVGPPEQTLFSAPSKPEIYNGFMQRLELAYDNHLRQRAGEYIQAQIARRQAESLRSRQLVKA